MSTSLIKRIEQLAGPAVAERLRAEFGGATHYVPNPRPARTGADFEASAAAQADELQRLIAAREAAIAWEPRA